MNIDLICRVQKQTQREKALLGQLRMERIWEEENHLSLLYGSREQGWLVKDR